MSIRERAGDLSAEEGKTGTIVWTIASPYVFVGGMVEAEEAGARFKLSWDAKTWHDTDRNLDAFFPPDGPARYRYHLKCELTGAAHLRRLRIKNDLQMAPLTLPEMGVGTNPFTYSDDSKARRIRITHEWVERSATRPPRAPAKPVFPPSEAVIEGTEFAFRWQPADDPESDAIADYHFELSARADMRWPLSLNFAKLISRTSDAGHPRYTLPAPGLLNPATQYFWHVRAKDDNGVWGPWSSTWSFTSRAPAPPRDVRIEFDRERIRGVLRWAPNPLGQTPVAYRIYASDEKGFSASERAYKVTVGSTEKLPADFPANFLAQSPAAELEVIGPQARLAGANKAFYRVVAIDAAGNRSGPSDYAECPRPFIVSPPVTDARVGTAYRYPIAAIRSLGDLRTRVIQGKETMSFWDIERLRFNVERGPRWLTIDQATGQISGTPDLAGPTEVIVSVTLERDVRRLDEEPLKWGIEKVIASGTETAGNAAQRFVIEVRP